MKVVFIVITLVVFHAVDGSEVAINPEQVTSLREPKLGPSDRNFVAGASCLISLTDGRFVTVAESCDAVEKEIGVVK